MDSGSDGSGEVEMGLDDFTGGVSLLFGDGDGSECIAGVYHDGSALSGLDIRKTDGSGQLVGVGLAGVADLGSASGGGYGVSTFVSGCRGTDGFSRANSSEVGGLGKTGPLDSDPIDQSVEKGGTDGVDGRGDSGGGLGCSVGGIVVAWDFYVSSDHSSGFGGECGGGSDCGGGDSSGSSFLDDGAILFGGCDRNESFKCPVGSFVSGGVGVDGGVPGRPFCRVGSEIVVRAGTGGGDCGGGWGYALLGERRRREVVDRTGIKDRLGKFRATLFELLWSKSVGWGDVGGGFGETIGFRTGVIGVDADRLVGRVRFGRKIRGFEAVEIGNGRKKRREEIFCGGRPSRVGAGMESRGALAGGRKRIRKGGRGRTGNASRVWRGSIAVGGVNSG